MRRILWGLMASPILLTSPAWADTLSVRLGVFVPRGKSDIWDLNRQETTLTTGQMVGGTLGVGYDLFAGRWFNAAVAVSFYERDRDVEDRDYVYPDGTPIVRTIQLSIVPVEASLKFLPLGRTRRRAIPYVGGGLGIYFWRYAETGDFVFNRGRRNAFIDFGDFRAEGQDLGWHVMAGLQIPIGRRATLDWEAKYTGLNGKLGPQFDPSFQPIDLSGWTFTGGLSFWW